MGSFFKNVFIRLHFFCCNVLILRAWLHHIWSLTPSPPQKKKPKQNNAPPTSTDSKCVQAWITEEATSRGLDVVHTSFAGAWHTDFCNGRDYGVVPIVFANQVDYPVCDLFDGAVVQAMVPCWLQEPKRWKRRKKNRLACPIMCQFILKTNKVKSLL